MISESLRKNLDYIKQYNPDLAKKIENCNSVQNQYSIIEAKNSEPNLSFNLIPIHSQDDPEQEASNIRKSVSGDGLTHTHIVFGLGLGYLFQDFCENMKGKIILYEPSIEILRVTFEIVDFSKNFESGKVFVVNNELEFKAIFDKICGFCEQLTFNFLNFYKMYFAEEFKKALDEVKIIYSTLNQNFYFQETKNMSFFYSAFENFSKRLLLTDLKTIRNKFKNIPAIVVSGGPSLKENIEILKKYQTKAVIFAVGTTLQALQNAGITPDFIVSIEMFNHASQFVDIDVSKSCLITETYSNGFLLDKNFKKKFVSYSIENVTNLWFANLLDKSIDDYETKGTVSFCALNSAYLLGCSPIILLGQDLAFKNGSLYAAGTPLDCLKYRKKENSDDYEIYVDSLDEFIEKSYTGIMDRPRKELERYANERLKELNNEFCFVKGQHGEMLPTSNGYKLFVSYFKYFALNHKNEVELINSSIGGALIKNYKNIPLENAIKIYKKNKPNIDEIINNIEDKSELEINKKVLKKLDKEIELLEKLISDLISIQKYSQKYKLTTIRHKTVTEEGNLALKNALELYIKILDNYSSKNPLVSTLILGVHLRMEYELKELDEKYDYNSLMIISKALEDFCTKPIEPAKEMIKEIEKLKKELICEIN